MTYFVLTKRYPLDHPSQLPSSYSHVVPQKLVQIQKAEIFCCNYYKCSQESLLNGVARHCLTAAFIEQIQSL